MKDCTRSGRAQRLDNRQARGVDGGVNGGRPQAGQIDPSLAAA